MVSAGGVTSATRPLAVGSPLVPLAAQREASLPAVLSAGWPCRARNCCRRQALFTVRVEAQCPRHQELVPHTALRGTAAPSCGPSMRRRVRPHAWRLSAPAARMQVMQGQAPNPSIERTPSSRLRRLAVAAHVER